MFGNDNTMFIIEYITNKEWLENCEKLTQFALVYFGPSPIPTTLLKH